MKVERFLVNLNQKSIIKIEYNKKVYDNRFNMIPLDILLLPIKKVIFINSNFYRLKL